MSFDTPIARFLLLLGLGFFFGLAFEEFHAPSKQGRPGGVRSFPLLALSGGLLYRLNPTSLLPLTAGLLILGAWLAAFYWVRLRQWPDEAGSLMTPICNLLAYIVGPVALAEPPWVAVGTTVAAVLFLTARERLHTLARRIPTSEIVTAGTFLILTGLVLPLLPDHPVTSLTTITPEQVWLAVIAVCTVSYASYLVQTYLAPPGATLWTALLGGLYSSTATTIVLAKRAGTDPSAQTGIILASAVMYLRLLVIILIFSQSLGVALTPALLGLSALGLLLAAAQHLRTRGAARPGAAKAPASNPLELGAAVIFAVLFVVISLASTWAQQKFGTTGLYVLAAIVGVSDIDPFVLSLAEHGNAQTSAAQAVIAILIAIASNNLLKAGYTAAFAGPRQSLVPGGALVLLALAGLAVAWGGKELLF